MVGYLPNCPEPVHYHRLIQMSFQYKMNYWWIHSTSYKQTTNWRPQSVRTSANRQWKTNCSRSFDFFQVSSASIYTLTMALPGIIGVARILSAGVHFFFCQKSWRPFFSRRRLNIPPNLSHPAKTPKIDSCSGWGCTSCPAGVHLHIFFCKLGLTKISPPWGVQVHPLHPLASLRLWFACCIDAPLYVYDECVHTQHIWRTL